MKWQEVAIKRECVQQVSGSVIRICLILVTDPFFILELQCLKAFFTHSLLSNTHVQGGDLVVTFQKT